MLGEAAPSAAARVATGRSPRFMLGEAANGSTDRKQVVPVLQQHVDVRNNRVAPRIGAMMRL